MSDIALSQHSHTAHMARAATAPVYLIAIFLSATLVFSVQPMFAKMVLPIVGGSAAVWNVALVFFQAALLVGYAFAHFLQRLPLKAQVGGHLAALALAGLSLPMAAAAGFTEPPQEGQALWLIALFAVSVGAPFVVISATAPLLQAWFSKTGRPDAADPYFLYAASNAGSLLALVSYPLVIEPVIGASAQSSIWTWSYCVLGVLIAGCGLLTISIQPSRAQTSPGEVENGGSALSGFRSNWRQRGAWLLFSFAPSMLLVAASTHINTDVASAPLLWVAPLALYLLAFIMAFMKKPMIAPRYALLLHLVMTVSALVLMWSYVQWTSLLAITLSALFFGVLICCQELYRRRPDAAGLTEFYMWMSLGGVLGGASAALLAPLVFNSIMEYPLALALTLALRPWGAPTAKSLIQIAVAAIVVAAALVAVPRLLGMPIMPLLIYGGMLFVVIAMVCVQRHPLALALCALAVIGIGKTFASADNIYATRGFYGVMDVSETDDGKFRLFTHGTTVHGVQRRGADAAHLPAGYYGPLTPIGETFRTLNESGRVKSVAVMGLGAGAMSCYARPDQSWVFYEIDPLVAKVATNPKLFTLVSGCAPQSRIEIGDGRLFLGREPNGAFDLLLVDAFSSDAVPTHLLTQEAMKLYLSKLSENGVAMIHVSNRNLALADIVARTAASVGAVIVERNFSNPIDDGTSDRWNNLSSHAILIARSDEALAPVVATGNWSEMTPSQRPVWTDDYTNILEPLVTRMSESQR